MQFGAKTKTMDKNNLGLAQFDLFLVQSSFYLLLAQQGGLASGRGAPNISCEA